VFGCLLAGFYLLRVHNMPIATFVAVVLGVTVALAAFALARSSRAWPLAPDEAPAERDAPRRRRGAGRAPGVYLAIAPVGR
jgi:spermidine synthase